MDSIRRGRPSSRAPAFGAAFAFALLASTAALAQKVPRSFEASPDIYKVVAEDAKFRLIEVTWKPGQRDNWHSHGDFTAVYNLTDCRTKARTPDGKVTENSRKAGEARFGVQSPSHSIENAGRKDCKVLIFEPK
jgi:hypothetical protein